MDVNGCELGEFFQRTQKSRCSEVDTSDPRDERTGERSVGPGKFFVLLGGWYPAHATQW